jgi:hypothetical protein
MSPNAGEGSLRGLSGSAVTVYGSQINFGDLTPYLTCVSNGTAGVVRWVSFKRYRGQQAVGLRQIPFINQPHKVLTYVEWCVWRLPKYRPPTPSPPSGCVLRTVLPPHQKRRVHTRRAVRWMGGSIFWKTPAIGLASYNNLSTINPIRTQRQSKTFRKTGMVRTLTVWRSSCVCYLYIHNYIYCYSVLR